MHIKNINHNGAILKARGDNMIQINQIKQKKNILDFLHDTEDRYGYSTAVTDGRCSMSWHELTVTAKRIEVQ